MSDAAHHFTVDVEEYFHPTAMEPFIPMSEWDGIPRRSPPLVARILERLADDEVRGTFFVLGWLARREPGMVRAISDAGHEIASHGWSHRRVTHLTPDELRDELRRSKETLEDITGARVEGYRAPSFSILPGLEWAFDTLIQEGYAYDSSVFPVRVHPSYGYPSADPDPHVIERPGGALVEVPPATLRLGSVRLPAAGGAYLRFFPVWLPHAALRSAAGRGTSATLYTHPWEWDRELRDVPGPFLTRLRMKGGIRHTMRRVRFLTGRHRFRPVRETVAELLATSGGAA